MKKLIILALLLAFASFAHAYVCIVPHVYSSHVSHSSESHEDESESSSSHESEHTGSSQDVYLFPRSWYVFHTTSVTNSSGQITTAQINDGLKPISLFLIILGIVVALALFCALVTGDDEWGTGPR